jgi:hypothetical protein
MWARLPGADLAVAVGRAGRSIHQRERERLDLLARTVSDLLRA